MLSVKREGQMKYDLDEMKYTILDANTGKVDAMKNLY